MYLFSIKSDHILSQINTVEPSACKSFCELKFRDDEFFIKLSNRLQKRECYYILSTLIRINIQIKEL